MNIAAWMLLFYLAACVLFYTYLGYPMLVILWSRIWPRPIRQGEYEPSVSIVLAVHNEEHNISTKIMNLLALDYPVEKVSLVIVNDGSTDNTSARVKEIQQSRPDRHIALIECEQPSGKPVALHRGVLQSDSECILFCDARQTLSPNSLQILAATFADPSVGAASGELRLDSDKGPGLYWKYEHAIRMSEGAIDSVVGVTGALYMIRRELYQPFPAGIILDDLWLPMQIANQGYRILVVEGAIAYDKEAEIQREFQRKTRTLAGNFQLLAMMPSLLFPWSNRLFWFFVSHKLCRLICPYFLVLLLLSNAVIVWLGSSLFLAWLVLLLGQLGFYFLALGEGLKLFSLGRVSRIAHTFVVLNWAAVVGLKRFFFRDFRWTR